MRVAFLSSCALVIAGSGCALFTDFGSLSQGSSEEPGSDAAAPVDGGVGTTNDGGESDAGTPNDGGADAAADAPPPCTKKSTGVKTPGLVEVVGNTLAWTNPAGAKMQDGTTTVVALAPDDESSFLVARSFGFAIPDGATVQGVKVLIRHRGETSDEIRDREVRLYVKGAAAGDDKKNSDKWALTDEEFGYGGEGTTWGLPQLKSAEVSADDFGVRLQARNSSLTKSGAAHVDVIKVDVTYCE